MAKKEKIVKEKKQKSNSYFKEMKAELKKVVWPTPKELFDNTVAVIAFVLIIAVIVFILDLCFDNLNKYGITRLQEGVQSSIKNDDENSSESDTSNENTEESDSNTENSDDTDTSAETTENSEENSGETTESSNAEVNESEN